MTIVNRLKNAYSALKGQPNIYNVQNWQKQSGLYDFQGNKAEMLEQYKSWVFACVNIIAKRVASAKFRLYLDSGADEMVEINEHPILDLLRSPNPYYTKEELLFETVAHIQLTGDGYWYKASDGIGIPRELWVLPPDKMKIFPSDTNFIHHYELRTYENNPVKFGVGEIVHHRYPNPNDQYYGASVLMSAAQSVDIDEYQHTYQRKFYQNGAAISGVLQTDSKLDKTTFDRLRQEWSSRYTGGDNAGKTAILEQGLKYSAVGVSPKDLDWLASNRVTRDDICAIFGVPAALLGLVEDVNRANGETQEYTFHRQVVEPNLDLLDSRLTKDLAQPFDKRLIIKHDSTIPYDDLRDAQAAKERLSFGVTTINEERKRQGFKPVEGGDKNLVPLNYTDLNTVGNDTNNGRPN